MSMNFSTTARCGSPSRKENVPPSTKRESFLHQRSRPRTVLGVLSENEQHSQSFSQGSQYSRHSSVSDNSQPHFLCGLSSSGCDVYVEEACEVVLGASGRELVSEDSDSEDKNQSMRLLLELSSSSRQEASGQSEHEESWLSRETFCAEYAEDIYHNLKKTEKRFLARKGYLERHGEITSGMRVVLVDWLVEVSQEYRMSSDTLYLAVNYTDRFMSCTTNVKRNKLQLVGTASLLIAAKYEEIAPPDLNEFVYITDSTYCQKQLLHMESLVLRVLAFRLAAPTPHLFLRLFLSVHSSCVKTENLALYIAELSLLEMNPFLQYTPSLLAAGAYSLASYTVHKVLWPDALVAFTGYTAADIMPCLTHLHKLHASAESRPQQAIRDKFKSSKNRNNPNRKHHKCLPLEKPDEVLQHFTVTLQDLRLQASTSTPSNDVFATFELYFPDLPVWFIVSAVKSWI
uniref:G2/mitotic-specific cyclin-B2 n=1 Tax=Oryzias melastigma TaxID=30732 RepID=A0A3B3C0N2_ORYME